MRQERWSDGEPTQVEEDLWDDSHLNVSALYTVIELKQIYWLFRCLCISAFFPNDMCFVCAYKHAMATLFSNVWLGSFSSVPEPPN